MDALPRKGSGGGACPDCPAGIHEAYAGVLRACRFAGLTLSDAEDVAQDVFLWLFESGPLLAVPAMPWLTAVAQNFIRRYWREKGMRETRESRAAAEAAMFPRRGDDADALELQLSLDQIERRLPEIEAKLLHLLRQGCSFTEVATRLDIPRGSRTFFRNRLIEHATESLRVSSCRSLWPTTRLSGKSVKAPTAGTPNFPVSA